MVSRFARSRRELALMVGAVTVGILLAVLDDTGDLADSGVFQVFGLALCVLGMAGSWRTALAFAMAYLTAAVVETALFWEGNPELTGIDRLSNSEPHLDALSLLPFAAVALGVGALLGWAVRQLWPQRWSIGT